MRLPIRVPEDACPATGAWDSLGLEGTGLKGGAVQESVRHPNGGGGGEGRFSKGHVAGVFSPRGKALPSFRRRKFFIVNCHS